MSAITCAPGTGVPSARDTTRTVIVPNVRALRAARGAGAGSGRGLVAGR
ncbi:MAG: hypothetical protein M5U08_01935 [Burkholderiales bacterium]|nr:hypothetical protein [Burkholderiales bacterium]